MRQLICVVIAVGVLCGGCCSAQGFSDYVPGVPMEVDDVNLFLDFLGKTPANRLLLIKIQVPGCSACLTLAPKLVELAAQYPDVTFINVNYMTVWPVLLEYKLSVVPTCIFTIKGQEVSRVMSTKKDAVEAALIPARALCLGNGTATVG